LAQAWIWCNLKADAISQLELACNRLNFNASTILRLAQAPFQDPMLLFFAQGLI
jgi:hypothetical protein